MNKLVVGIDDLNLYAGTLAVNFSEIASARNISNKDLHNIRFTRRSVLPPYEDPITLAVNAAKPIIDANPPETFALLIIATETGIDYAKPISSYVHRYLNLGEHCRNFEIKHACYAGTAALQMAASWLRSGVSANKKALIIMADIGRAHFGEMAELSIGLGAIAISMSINPRLFELEPYSGFAAQEVYDTARPTATFEHIDRVLSLGAYLDLIEIAWLKYKELVGPVSFTDHFAYMIYHTPLISLIEQAHQLLLENETDQYLSHEEAQISFAQMTRPTLEYVRELGNIYSGSLYVGLIGLLSMSPSVAPGTRVGCFSYGSGSCAEIFSGRIGEQVETVMSARKPENRLVARRKVSVSEYEAYSRIIEQSLASSEFEPDWNRPTGHYEESYHGKGLLILDKVNCYYRTYKWS